MVKTAAEGGAEGPKCPLFLSGLPHLLPSWDPEAHHCSLLFVCCGEEGNRKLFQVLICLRIFLRKGHGLLWLLRLLK